MTETLTAGALHTFALARLTDPPLPESAPSLGALIVGIDALRALLASVKADAEAAMHDALGDDKTITVDGLGGFTRTRQRDRKEWDNVGLLRMVLDSTPWMDRTSVDPDTGEKITARVPVLDADESPLDKVLAVWNLGAPRTTVLRERNIDPDEFCSVETGRPTIKVIPAESRPLT